MVNLSEFIYGGMSLIFIDFIGKNSDLKICDIN